MMSIQEFSTGPILSAQFHLLTPITSLSWERRRGRHYTPLLSLTLNHFSFASSPPYYLHQSSPSSAFSSLCCSPSLTFLLSAKISNASPTSTYSHILLNYLLQIHLFLYPFTQFKPLHKIIYYPPPPLYFGDMSQHISTSISLSLSLTFSYDLIHSPFLSSPFLLCLSYGKTSISVPTTLPASHHLTHSRGVLSCRLFGDPFNAGAT